jgi:hypothetical protein
MAELFRNSSPGALTREQAVALLKKRAAERRRQMQQAQELAAQGRGEDTEIAHVARGEFVVPEALQTSEFMATLERAAAAHNIPLERLRVGNNRNSINPGTGLPEFSYSGAQYDRDPRRQIPGQQVADVYINRFPGAAGGFGHVGIGVNTYQTKGFYPAEAGMSVIRGKEVPGVVRNDNLNEFHDTVRIPTSKEQDAAIQAYIDRRGCNPGNYDLYNRQCTDFVSGALRAGGLTPPSDLTPERYDDVIPNAFFQPFKTWFGR